MHATPISVSAKSPSFDKLAFLKYVKDNGRAYRERSIELISICRTFSQAKKKTRSSYNELKSVQRMVDDALSSATEARKKTSNDTDWKIKKAIIELCAYERKYYLRVTVPYAMAEAEAMDKPSSTTILTRVEETLRVTRPLKEESTKEVEFFLHKSLPDKNPISVKLVLSESSNFNDIFWNFSLFKGERRLTLKDNPHFYEMLPTSPDKYEGDFRMDPMETFLSHHKIISVLTDSPRVAGRMILETAEETRFFGNIWVPKEGIIFKDLCGKLEGENIIGSAIKSTPNLWCFEDPSLSNTPWPESPDRSNPLPTTTATPITSPTGALLGDWREPIFQMSRSPDVNFTIHFRIVDNLHTALAPATQSHQPNSSSIVSSLVSPTPQSQASLG